MWYDRGPNADTSVERDIGDTIASAGKRALRFFMGVTEGSIPPLADLSASCQDRACGLSSLPRPERAAEVLDAEVAGEEVAD